MTENKIKNISNDYLLNNTLKIKLENLYGERAKYTKKKIEDFNKNYEIKPFNLTFNIGEKTETIIKRLYENLFFNFIKDYLELFELNRHIFSESLLEIINIKKEEIVNKYNEITNEFYDELNRYSEEYIDDNYIKEYFNNYTNCLNYSIDELNETLIKDEKNYNKYVIHNNKIEICSKMKECLIETRSFWKPVHLQIPYSDCPKSDVSVSEGLWQRIITLPCSTNITNDDLETVSNSLINVINNL
jgi:hypothetical protein